MSRELSDVTIRKAVIGDIRPIHRLLNHFGDQGILLPRSLSNLYEHLRDFFVVSEAAQDSEILGACALAVCWEDLAEIRSLALVESRHREGLGSMLVKTSLEEAASLGIRKVFALTYEVDFFAKAGFSQVERSVLPHKIWADCIKCPKFPDCDEEALVIEL